MRDDLLPHTLPECALRVEWALPPTFTDRDGSGRHALAALALHGQPFGFTREDVAALWFVIQEREGLVGAPQHTLRSLAERIEALLPPETP